MCCDYVCPVFVIICLSVCVCICQFASTRPFVYIFFRVSVSLPVYLPAYLSTSVFLSVHGYFSHLTIGQS